MKTKYLFLLLHHIFQKTPVIKTVENNIGEHKKRSNVHAKEDPNFFPVSLFSFVNRQKSFGVSTVFNVCKQSKDEKRLGG